MSGFVTDPFHNERVLVISQSQDLHRRRPRSRVPCLFRTEPRPLGIFQRISWGLACENESSNRFKVQASRRWLSS